jgi:plasmid stability protein
MKTTLDLPERLVREMKIRAATEGRKLREVATDIIEKGLAMPAAAPEKKEHRVELPIIHCEKVVRPEDRLTPEQIDEILLNEEIQWLNEINETAGR